MNILTRIFSNNNENYNLAKTNLSRVKNRLSEFIDNFPDVTIPEILYIESKWFDLPQSLGGGVKVLGLEIGEKYSTVLVHFKRMGFLVPHTHKDEYELNKVIKGCISNKLTGERFVTGDTFVIDKNEKHHLVANEETYVYCLTTKNEQYLSVPHLKSDVLRLFKDV